MTIAEAFSAWNEGIRPDVESTYGADDEVALSESWNDYTDSLTKDGELNGLQYHYCPAWDDSMPDDDVEFICDQMGLVTSTEQLARRDDSDDWAEGSTHWRVTFVRGEKSESFPFSMGPAHTSQPDPLEVLQCVLSDSDSADQSFEDWAYELGFDEDSRRAERIFKACQETRVKVMNLFKESEIEDLRELMD